MRRILSVVLVVFSVCHMYAQQVSTVVADPEAGALLEKAAAKYKSYKGIDADFTLTMIRPKFKPDEPDSKYTTNDNGKLYMKGSKFKIIMNGNEVYCDGKTIASYSLKSKEIQVNDYEESKETFSPSKIFSVYKEGYAYQIKEKKEYAGKNVTVIELAPQNKKVSFFKIDVAVDDASHDILESKVYEKSGIRYIYKINKLVASNSMTDDFFVCDPKKYPGSKLVDLR